MRGPGVSIMLSRGRDRNSDTFSPDDLHGSFSVCGVVGCQQHEKLFTLSFLPVTGLRHWHPGKTGITLAARAMIRAGSMRLTISAAVQISCVNKQ